MTRIWLRLELFELGLQLLPIKFATNVTLPNVKRALEGLHQRLQIQPNDVDMTDTETSPVSTECDPRITVSFAVWHEAMQEVFQWREQDYKALWLLLVHFDRLICVGESVAPDVVLDEEYCLSVAEVPLYKITLYLFMQTSRPNSWRLKHAMESFNAVWHRENITARSETPTGAQSPQMKPASSPPPPSSPHTMGMQDRSISDAYFLSFVREKLEELLCLLYPPINFSEDSTALLSATQFDLLGFLFAVSDARGDTKLSSAYSAWKEDASSGSEGVELASALLGFLKQNLCVNEILYPPIKFSLSGLSSAMPTISSVSDLSLSDPPKEDTMNEESVQRPIIVANMSKTTVIKRPEEFAEELKHPDLIIFSCHDANIYILGPVRHVMIIACNNSRVVIGPSTGILCVDRCENVQVTAIASLIRVSNCLDSRMNVFTRAPLIMTGENLGVELGPFNTKYVGLTQQVAEAGFAHDSTSEGAWSSFYNLEIKEDAVESEKEPITLQSPASYREVCIPIKVPMGMIIEHPFPLPMEYVTSLRNQQDTVEQLRKLVCSDEFDVTTRRSIELVVQHRFKEWLTMTGNARQILDLVHIERTRSGNSTSGNSTQ